MRLKISFRLNIYYFLSLRKDPRHIWWITLHCITGQNFKQNWQYLGKIWWKKHPKAAWKARFCFLKIQNSGTKNPISIKLARYMYQPSTFYLLKTGNINRRGKNCHEFSKILNLASLKTAFKIFITHSLENAIRVRIFYDQFIIDSQQIYWG